MTQKKSLSPKFTKNYNYTQNSMKKIKNHSKENSKHPKIKKNETIQNLKKNPKKHK